jgi:metacaspase-1
MTKKALCVGINDYPFGEANDLRGCVNDANDWATLLKDHFDFTDVKQLLNGDATSSNILAHLKQLLSGAKAGDVLVFTNASHGTYLADNDKDEPKYDEAICPYDCDSNLIIDDQLRLLFADIPKDVRFTVISDSCHSGSVTRALPGEYRRARKLTPEVFGREALEPATLRAVRGKEKYLESGMNEILLSGCKSSQTSADAFIANDYHGAMSYYAIEAIRDAGFKLTYSDLHERLVASLADENYDQIPQLEGTDENKQRQVFT